MSTKLELIKRQNSALHKLNEITAISDISPKETLRYALEMAKEYFGLEFGIVSCIVGDIYTVDVQSSPPDTLYDGQIFSFGSTYCKTTLELDDVLAITDVTKSKYIGHPCHRELELVSYIGAPIYVNSKVYGTVNFSSPKARALKYDVIDNQFMRLLAQWTGSYLEKQLTLDELSQAKKRFEMIFENNASGILLVDENSTILMVNKRFCEIVAFSKEELIGKSSQVFDIDNISFEKLNDNANIGIEYQLKRKDNEFIWCEFFGSSIELVKNKKSIVWSILDITTQKKLQEKIKSQAITDYLTTLYNRRYFTNRLEEELSKIKCDNSIQTALIMFDLDYFKRINDTMGHLTGDFVLKEFATILKNNLRRSDIAGRVGGEEFAIVLPNCTIENATTIANKICLEVANKRLYYKDYTINFTVSIGVTTLYREDKDSSKSFFRADLALYEAKENGRNRVEVKN